MPLSAAFASFQLNAQQCSSLIANAHQENTAGVFVLPLLDRKQITVAAFLNLYIAWESFLETALAEYITGSPTSTGVFPVKYVCPRTLNDARALIIGVQKYFDYSNPETVKKLVRLYFENGYPFEPYLSSITTDLFDMKTLRNASAHLSSTTLAAFESLAQRILRTPSRGLDLYSLLLSTDPRSASKGSVFAYYQEMLLVTAELIVKG